MIDASARIDLPMLMRGLKSPDEVTAQNAGALLGYYACHNEEHREAIAAQQENIISPLVAQLNSGKNGLVHNAALLLGQCLMSGTEFRQAFAADASGSPALVAAMAHPDAGVACNVTWAMRHFASDGKIHVSDDLMASVESALPCLIRHEDARIRKHATGLGSLLQQRRRANATSIRRDKSMQAVQALTSIRHDERGDKSMQAVQALAALAVGNETTVAATALHALSCDEESSPTGTQSSKPLKAKSPSKSPAKSPSRRNSLLAPWKKVMAIQYTAVKERKFHAVVTQAAAG